MYGMSREGSGRDGLSLAALQREAALGVVVTHTDDRRSCGCQVEEEKVVPAAALAALCWAAAAAANWWASRGMGEVDRGRGECSLLGTPAPAAMAAAACGCSVAAVAYSAAP